MQKLEHRIAIAILLTLVIVITGCSKSEEKTAQASSSEKTEVNIGIQGVGLLLLQREKGWLEEAFSKAGAHVNWTEFPSGPPHFEAIAANRLDIGLVGNGPVIAGQAGNVDFKEIAVVGDGKRGDTILAHKDSGIDSIADLKGKKVAVAKGSSAYTFVYRAAVKSGLKPSDIKLIQLQPDDAKAAFDSKAVDAWAIWEPYVTIATNQGAKVLANGEQLDLYSPSFAIVRSEFAKKHPKLVELFLKEYQKALNWSKEHEDETIELYAKIKKVDPSIMKNVVEKSNPILEPISDSYIEAQQQTADLLFDTGGIKQKIDVKKVVANQYIKKALKE